MPAKTPKILPPLYERMRQDIILGGLAARTIDSYLRQVRKFEEYLLKSPDTASEDELRKYLLYIKNDRGWQANSLSGSFLPKARTILPRPPSMNR
jgi:integrase/recombinase XerD